MIDLLSLDLVEKGLATKQLVLTVGYDIENLLDPERAKQYKGEVVIDHYGRKVPKHSHGTIHLSEYTASTRLITQAMMELFDRITDPDLLVRRITVVACNVLPEKNAKSEFTQLDMFTDPVPEQKRQEKLARERRQQETLLRIKHKYGKNAILKGMNFQEGATTRDRNGQVGGHKA